MPKAILNAKHEKFAGLVASGLSLAEAYRGAGYGGKDTTIWPEASKLAKAPKVATRIVELRSALTPQRRAIIVTQASVTAMLAAAYEDAMLLGQPGAATQAAMGIAKLHGLLVDRFEDVTRKPGRSPDVPVEIEVEHWVNEITKGLPSPAATEPPGDSRGMRTGPSSPPPGRASGQDRPGGSDP